MLSIASSITNNDSRNKSVTFSQEYHYYDLNEWYTISKSDKDKVLMACSRRNGGNKSSKSGSYSKSERGSNNGQMKRKYKITMLEKKLGNQKRQLLVLNTAAKPGSDDE